ncbi:MAG: 30S ribosomal protein S4 [Patescibacteria group bacterium]|jgi:small subunit ribosomal protein S4
MPSKQPTSPRYRKSAQRLFLREKSIKSKNPSLVSVSAAISAASKYGSEYSRQLQEKQKVRRLYGINEGQFKLYYAKAAKSSANTAELMLRLLEKRLDNVVYRLGYASTRAHARQLVSHKFFKVNDQTVNIPSYQVSAGDKITLNKKFEPVNEESVDTIPSWLSYNKKTKNGSVVSEPERAHSDQDINEQLIVEYYSR